MRAKTKLRKQLLALIETEARLHELIHSEALTLLSGCKCPPHLYPIKTRHDLKKHNKNLKYIVRQMEWAIARINKLSVNKEDFTND